MYKKKEGNVSLMKNLRNWKKRKIKWKKKSKNENSK